MHTFLFADLAGFTALTEAMGDEEAVNVADDFCAAVRELLPEHGAEEVKAIGDALMIRAGDAGDAIRLGVRIVEEVGERHFFPAIRVGMHSGPAIERDGDWFGGTVNVAARVSGAAAGREVLLTQATLDKAGSLVEIELHERGRRSFKNVGEPLLLYAAVRIGAMSSSGLPIDPVCRMVVDPAHGAGSLVYDGAEYHFCSLTCAHSFAGDPSRYAEEVTAGQRDSDPEASR